ncbi:hypothetical protein M404DRAFT_866693 [Pisolithus tinctorius Marx 270]|uniref:Uncharacterized protein n=1 Tax=Pisolithus tinctorius Marx 270 TaxID=870435 RepID=A0A0C3JJZ0_PISTI|nr:hypothetical protein M404DRAFT_866693 [Pisolithus tinctorius Marx 270]
MHIPHVGAVYNTRTAKTQHIGCILTRRLLTLTLPERYTRHGETTYPDCGNYSVQNMPNQSSRHISEVGPRSPTSFGRILRTLGSVPTCG